MPDWTLDQANEIKFVMIDSAGTEVTGATLSVFVCKPGGTFGAAAGSSAELGNGWYKYTSTAGESDTSGELAIRVTAAGCLQQNLTCQVGAAAAVWASSTRTLTQSAASTESTTASKITRARGSTWTITISGLSLSGYTTIDFALKTNEGDIDNSAILWVRKNASGLNDGLLRINTAAVASPYASTDASMVVAGDYASVTITVLPVVTKDITPNRYSQALQTIISGVVAEPSSGTFVVSGDIVRAIS